MRSITEVIFGDKNDLVKMVLYDRVMYLSQILNFRGSLLLHYSGRVNNKPIHPRILKSLTLLKFFNLKSYNYYGIIQTNRLQARLEGSHKTIYINKSHCTVCSKWIRIAHA